MRRSGFLFLSFALLAACSSRSDDTNGAGPDGATADTGRGEGEASAPNHDASPDAAADDAAPDAPAESAAPDARDGTVDASLDGGSGDAPVDAADAADA